MADAADDYDWEAAIALSVARVWEWLGKLDHIQDPVIRSSFPPPPVSRFSWSSSEDDSDSDQTIISTSAPPSPPMALPKRIIKETERLMAEP